MQESELIQKHFEKIARDFDGIYDRGDTSVKGAINKLFRKGVHDRLAVTLEEFGSDSKTVLDLGCGSGRIALHLATKGMSVTGIDYSLEMIELAKGYLKKFNENSDIKLNINFKYCNFMKEFESNNLFDVTLAMGVLDYIKEPVPFLKKMKSLTREKLIVSFPAKFHFQTPIRKLWLYSKKCPVYFYTRNRISEIYNSLDISNYKIRDIAGGYVVTGYMSR